MTRALLLAAGLVLLAAAAVLRPAPPQGDVTAALGRSMGGLRVMVIDGLFLRAESQRKAGRVEDAAALYRTALALDPANEAATAFLAATYVQELMPQIPDPAERFAWWEEARTLLLEGLARRPAAAGLGTRLASLILDLPLADPALEPLLAAKLKRPRLLALRTLAAAARATGTLPRLGRNHLVRLAGLAPDVAAQALARGDTAVLQEALDIGREILLLRGPLMAQVHLDEESPVGLDRLLRAGIAAVEAVQAALGGGPRRAAEEALAAYESLMPQTRFVADLQALLDRGR